MWTHNYIPLSGSLALSALVAAIPIFALVVMLAGMLVSARLVQGGHDWAGTAQRELREQGVCQCRRSAQVPVGARNTSTR